MFITVWIISIIATVYIADQKKLGGGGYFFLSLITGPVAVIIVLLISDKKDQLMIHKSLEVNSLQEAKRQLQAIQYALYAQEEKIKSLEIIINKLSDSTREVPIEEVNKLEMNTVQPVAVASIEIEEPKLDSVKKSDMELDFGRNWLSKIGVVVLALGMAFLISYTFKYFGPFLKISFGFLVGGALFFTGIKVEAKEKLMNYGRALLGGAWAIIYFTTYAMYHFEASRIIPNQGLDLFLLSLVVVGMMAHTLRYRSEGMMAVALFVAYLTSTIGQITSFTVLSNLFLSVLVLFMVYRFQWLKILSLGIIMTYGVHHIWVLPNIMASVQMPMLFGITTSSYHDLMNFIILTLYWLVFFIGVHLVRSLNDGILMKTLAGTNFGNIALYSVFSYPIVLKLFYTHRFTIVFVEGLIYLASALTMKALKQEKMYISDIVAAVFAITFAISLKFLPTTTLILWLIEIPFLLFIGISFKEKIFNYFSYLLSALVAIRLVFLWSLGGMHDVSFFGLTWTWYGFMCFWASISMAGCFYLTQLVKQDKEFNSVDLVFDQVFSFAACFYFSEWIWSLVHQPWSAFSLSLLAWLFLVIGALLGLRRYRAYAYLAFISSVLVFLFENIYASDMFVKWFIVGCDVISIFGVYHVVKYLKQHKSNELFSEYESEITFSFALFVLVFAVHQYVFVQWISLSLGIASVVLILLGFISGNKTERMGGIALLALTLGRVILVDLSGLDIIFKIITLIVLGVLFLGVSYIYNRFSLKP